MRDRIIMLQECAEELGFSTIAEALDAGYHEVQDLVNGTFRLEKVDGQEEAHKAWLERKEQVIKNLKTLRNTLTERGDNESIKNAIIIGDAILFIEEGEV